MPSLLELGLVGGAAYLLYCIYWELTVGAARRRLIKSKGCEPVKRLPDWDPILGLGLFFRNSRFLKEHTLLENAHKRFQKMGNTFSLKLMGTETISTIEPENLKVIQSLEFKKWSLGSRRINAFVPFLGPGIFTTDGQAWAHSREMLRPNFTRSQVGDLETFETHVGHLIQAIPTDGSTVDLGELFFRLTIDSATEFLFGESTNCLAPGTSTVSSASFATSFNRGQDAIGFHFRLGPFAKFAPQSQFKKDTKYVHDFVDRFVDSAFARRGQEKGSRYVFSEEIVQQTSNRFQVRSELLNILLAGRDTTASLLSNAWFTISKRPDIWAKLQEEISVLNGQAPDFQQLKDMKYLRAVLNESLRVHPVVPGNSREALVDTTLPVGGGPDGRAPMFIPKGTIVNWSVYGMHRRKDFFGEDAEEFKPERWLGEKGLRPGWEYLPFNGGARICLGQQFALTEASYTTVRLLQAFKNIESRDPNPWMEGLTLTCTSFNGCKVALTPA